MEDIAMESGNNQKELFEFEKPKRFFFRFGNFVRKAAPGITLTLEKLVFISIGLIMAMVVVYVIGVERGKSLSLSRATTIQITPRAALSPAEPPKVLAVPGPAPVKEAPKVEAIVKTAVDLTAESNAGLYTIVVATFKGKESASKYAEQLKKDGFDVSILKSDPYFIVCVGRYRDKDLARPALAKIRKTHKDAYLKAR